MKSYMICMKCQIWYGINHIHNEITIYTKVFVFIFYLSKHRCMSKICCPGVPPPIFQCIPITYSNISNDKIHVEWRLYSINWICIFFHKTRFDEIKFQNNKMPKSKLNCLYSTKMYLFQIKQFNNWSFCCV